ncbi:MAG: MFS transporter [Candidatus Methylomirabilia bacterium]
MTAAADISLLFTTRILRIFAYGLVSVTLALYLHALGFGERTIGLLFSLALFGDIVISLWITTSADRRGRRRMLVLGAGLIVLAGGVISSTGSLVLVAAAAVIGVVSPNGSEIGPFISIEQSALSQIVGDSRRTRVFAWYNLAGSFAAALGALAGGALVQGLRGAGYGELASYRAVLYLYAGIGVVLGLLFMKLSPAVEAPPRAVPRTVSSRFGLHRSKKTVFKLSGLFALDAFGGGFVIQGLLVYWFHLRFAVEPAALGGIFFGVNLLAGISALLADRIAARIGLIRTMVFTHIPSNLLLMLVPLMPSLPAAVGLLLVRYSISQMDVPTRQSYTMAVVDPDERSAAAGVTTIARSVGALVSPGISGALLAVPALMSTPFFFAGTLKIAYDLLLYRAFKERRPPEEAGR